jgi:selenide,water dikinase
MYFEQWVSFAEGISEELKGLLFDPETSGGLLMAVPPENADRLMADLAVGGDVAQCIGRVVPGSGRLYVYLAGDAQTS